MSPYTEKDSCPSEKAAPKSSHTFSRSIPPNAPRHHRREGAEYRDLPPHEHFYSHSHAHPPPFPPHFSHHPHGFPPPPPPPPSYSPHMMDVLPKDPFYDEIAHRKPKRSPLRKVLFGCIVCLVGVTVFTLGRLFEVHWINTVLKGTGDSLEWPIHAPGVSEWTWGRGPDCKFQEENDRFKDHGFNEHGKFMEHGKHGGHHHPPPPPDFMDAHMEEWDFDEHHESEPKRHHGKGHHGRYPKPPFPDSEVSDDDSDDGNAS